MADQGTMGLGMLTRAFMGVWSLPVRLAAGAARRDHEPPRDAKAVGTGGGTVDVARQIFGHLLGPD